MGDPMVKPVEIDEKGEEKWHHYLKAAENSHVDVPDDTADIAMLKCAFGFSEFCAATCVKYPDIPHSLSRSKDLVQTYEPGRYKEMLADLISNHEKMNTRLAQISPPVLFEDELMCMLRKFRQREMVRIAARDISGDADFDESAGDLSRLAAACLDTALALLYDHFCSRFGTPVNGDGIKQHLVILGMGKLGAGELNFSSDIDLIFAYPSKGETTGKKTTITTDEFFTRLCRSLIKVVGATTVDGFIFRVDTRLRPFGDSGPLVMSFDQMEDYYQEQGREWERYALIKAGVAAGDKSKGAELLNRLKPFVYRKYLDYGAFESLRDMKMKIALEVRRKGLKNNIKLGAGGIREIEFFGQMFQLIRGGVMPELQESRIRKVLAVIGRENIVSESVCRDLDRAYVFLRTVEHRLQESEDRQTHDLPQDQEKKHLLAVCMGFSHWDEFRERLEAQRATVHRHFSGLLKTGDEDGAQEDAADLEGAWQSSAAGDEDRAAIASSGFNDPEMVLNLLGDFKADGATRALSARGRARLDRLMPKMLKEAALCDYPETVLDRLLTLLKSIQRRISYLSLLLEHPAALTHLVKLAAASSWIASYLSRHPVLLDELLDSRTLYVPPGKKALENDLERRLARIHKDDLESFMDELRIFRQVSTLRTAACDITSVLPLMKVSDHLSFIAEAVLEKVVAVSWAYLVEKHGRPIVTLDGKACDTGFTVIGYGKLGGLELGYGSDLDLVFLHAAEKGETAGGRRPIDNTQFFARLGQRVVHVLTAHTPAGILYDTDMRLRPSGISGLLVSHIEGFRDYQLKEAWTWEHQALLKARPITGDPALMDRFQAIRKEVLCIKRDKVRLRDEVRTMRERIRKERLVPKKGVFHVKQSHGAMMDVEFLVQYLALFHASACPDIVKWTDNVRLLQSLAKANVVDPYAAFGLRRAYLIFRAIVHRCNLREADPEVPVERFLDYINLVRKNWNIHITSGKNGAVA